MEFDRPLVRAHGVIYSFSRTNKDYTRLLSLKDDLDDVNEVAKNRMIFFFVLNTEMNVSQYLSIDPYVSYISQICRKLDFKALAYTIFNLKLCKYLHTIAKNSPAVFTIEVLNGIFPYAESKDQLCDMECLLPAILQKILKIIRKDHKESGTTYKLWDLMDTCADLLWSRNRLNSKGLDGRDVYNIIEVCLVCVNIYDGNIPLSFDPMFEIKMVEPPSKKYEFELLPDPDLRIKFRDFLRRLFCYLDGVESWCTLTDLPAQDVNRMRERAYILNEKLDNSDYKPRNTSFLRDIKKKPDTALMKPIKTDINTIISCVESGPCSDIWLRALIYVPDSLKNEKAVACIRERLQRVESSDVRVLASLIEDEVNQNSQTDALVDLYFTSLKTMALIEQISRLERSLSLNHKFRYDESLLDEEIKDAFNRIVISKLRNIHFKANLVRFCILSPLKTIENICRLAVFSRGEFRNSVDDLRMLKPACVLKINSQEDTEVSLINVVLCNLMDTERFDQKERELLKALVMRLLQVRILDETIEPCVMKIIHKNMESARYDMADVALEIFASFMQTESFASDKVITLAFFSQILNRASWNCSSYSKKLEQLRDTAINAIRFLMNEPGLSPNAEELAWLRTRIMNCGKINRVYFSDLWYLHDNDLIPSSDLHGQILLFLHSKIRAESTFQFLLGYFKSQNEKDFTVSLTTALLQILPILTISEWPLLWGRMKRIVQVWLEVKTGKTDDRTVSLGLLQIVTKSLFCLAQDMNAHRDIMPCFTYCIQNFGKIVQTNFLAENNLDIDAAYIIVKEIMFLLSGIKDSNSVTSSSVILFPIITGLVNRFPLDLGTVRGSNMKKFMEKFKTNFMNIYLK